MNDKIKIAVILIIIGIISLGFKLYFVDFTIPVHNDDVEYTLNAIAHGEGDFSQVPKKGSGWPLFVSLFFRFVDSNDFLDYSNIIRTLSIAVSTTTIFAIYGLSRKFFDPKYSLVAASLFAFIPYLNYNASFGFTDPLYILTITLSLYLILNKNIKFAYLSFIVVGLAWWIRFEGIIVFFAILIIYFINFRKSNSYVIAKFGLCLLLFLVVISPIFIIRNDQYNDPFYFYYNDHLFVENYQTEGLTSNSTASRYIEQKGLGNFLNQFVLNGIIQLLSILPRLTFPYLFILLPFGLIFSLRAFDQESKYIKSNWIFILVTIALMIIPFSVLSDMRFLLYLLPSLIIFSVIAMQRMVEYGLSTFSYSKKQKNIFLIIVLSIFLIFSGIYTTQFDRVDPLYEHEVMTLADFLVYNLDGKILTDHSYDQYIIISKINEIPGNIKNFRINHDKEPHQGFPYDVTKSMISLKGDSLQTLLINAESNNVNFIIINDKNVGFEFLDDIFKNEKNYPFLIKVFDSSQENFEKLRVKIFQINYDYLAN